MAPWATLFTKKDAHSTDCVDTTFDILSYFLDVKNLNKTTRY